MLFNEIVDVCADGGRFALREDPAQTSAKSKESVDALAAVNMVSNYRCVRPSIPDSGGTLARGT